MADGDGRDGGEETDACRVDADVDVSCRLEDAEEPAIEHLGDAVATHRRRVGRHVGQTQPVQSRCTRRQSVEYGHCQAADRLDRFHPD